jgi:hypothetical protein
VWLSTLCESCGLQCWKLTDPSTVKAGWLSESKCTRCGKADVVVWKDPPLPPPPDVPWLKWALVEAGLDRL